MNRFKLFAITTVFVYLFGGAYAQNEDVNNLLKMEREKHVPDALGIYGSWAGAFGWSQFLPSSYLLRAVDGARSRLL